MKYQASRRGGRNRCDDCKAGEPLRHRDLRVLQRAGGGVSAVATWATLAEPTYGICITGLRDDDAALIPAGTGCVVVGPGPNEGTVEIEAHMPGDTDGVQNLESYWWVTASALRFVEAG